MILPRQFYYDDCEFGDCNDSAWTRWIRWLVLGLIILAAILIFFFFSCLSARRRRRNGYAPYRGTGWTTFGHGPVTYANYAAPQQEQAQQTPYYATQAAAPPAYSPPQNRTYYGQNDGNNIELQQPENVYGGYRTGEEAYAPKDVAPPVQKTRV